MDTVNFLLVDDLEENLLSLEALLKRKGLSILKARSGDEALELLLQHEVALAFIDVRMPGLDGFELAELMRGNERARRIPIIFVTAGNADTQRRFRGYETGAVDFIYKPIEPDILRSKADVFFELYRQRQQIAEQRDALQIQAVALRDADRRKDEFLATLAHELRNPLAPLRSGLDLLQRDREPESAATIMGMMDRQLVHLVRLIDDLLDVSRIRSGKIELLKQKISVKGVIDAALETSRPLIDEAHHALTIDMTDEPLWIEADLTRLAQVVSNLLNNAAKYTPEGGNIELSVKRDDNFVAISVVDNGVGIPAEMRSEVFDLFAQIDNHLDRSRGGLGIGLALVKQLVAMHEGVVDVESEGDNKGSAFTVRIPLSSPCVSREDASPTDPASAPPMKVLVIDDMIVIAQTVGWMLEEMGHSYELVHDGRQALDSALKFDPDIILLDIGLPGMDGYEVCRVLRQNPAFRDTPIIAQTGWGQEKDKTLAREAGFNRHLVKPVSYDDLERVLADSTRNRNSGVDVA